MILPPFRLPLLPACSLFACTVLLTGCLMFPGKLGYDNPDIRQHQAEQSAKVIPSKARRQTLARACSRKVYCIKNQDTHIGRAAAISSDGYFLTAYHVVETTPFFLAGVDLTPAEQRQFESNGFLLSDPEAQWQLEGRIVWFDKGADLAILKFPHHPAHHFSHFQFPSMVGSVVHTADDLGQIMLRRRHDGHDPGSTAIGNGPFFSAGRVLFSQLFTHGPGVHTIGTTLIARGGMSGSAIVSDDGKLCGVISTAGYGYQLRNQKVEKWMRSTARMLPPDLIREILRNDRNSR